MWNGWKQTTELCLSKKKVRLYLSDHTFSINIINHSIIRTDYPISPVQLARLEASTIQEASFRHEGHANWIRKWIFLLRIMQTRKLWDEYSWTPNLEKNYYQQTSKYKKHKIINIKKQVNVYRIHSPFIKFAIGDKFTVCCSSLMYLKWKVCFHQIKLK